MNRYMRCYAEISLEAIRHNIREVKKRVSANVKLLVVVKADAYGHGAVKVAGCLEPEADYFAVATLDEAIELREHEIKKPILILGYVSPACYDDVIKYDITQTVDSYSQAQAMEETALRLKKKAKVHIAVDTGMTRIGFQVTEEDANEAARIALLPHVELEGMFTHFSCADQEDKTYCGMQMEKFDKMTQLLLDRNVTIPIRHICNSAGIMEFDDHRFDMVRSGIVTYGIYPSPEVKKERMDLIPALAWRCHVVHVKEVGPGLGVSYGATYVTDRPSTRIATVSVGYADGYPRALSNRGYVLIHGQAAPIIGRVCMDQMMVDVSDIPDVKVEDVVTLVGRDGDHQITIEEVADPAARFDYEMLCNISKRVERVYAE
ncbi:MAG: alanine racemase [Fusicatenibacter sp.]|nr:alanine racemase [Fusicatenibacter sp.]